MQWTVSPYCFPSVPGEEFENFSSSEVIGKGSGVQHAQETTEVRSPFSSLFLGVFKTKGKERSYKSSSVKERSCELGCPHVTLVLIGNFKAVSNFFQVSHPSGLLKKFLNI